MLNLNPYSTWRVKLNLIQIVYLAILTYFVIGSVIAVCLRRHLGYDPKEEVPLISMFIWFGLMIALWPAVLHGYIRDRKKLKKGGKSTP